MGKAVAKINRIRVNAETLLLMQVAPGVDCAATMLSVLAETDFDV
jgi:hypothetical protein